MNCVYSIGVTGVTFEAAHITSSREHGDYGLHGHTYRIDVEVCSGKLDNYQMVVDVAVLKDILYDMANEFNHKLLLGEKQLRIIEGHPTVVFEGVPQVTMEVLAKYVATRVYRKLMEGGYSSIGKVCVTIWQGLDEYTRYCVASI